MAQTTTSSTSLPSYVEKPIKNSLGSIEDWLNSDSNYVYGSKPGENLYTPLSDLQTQSIGNAQWLGDQNLADLFGINQAGGMLTDFANYTPDTISPEKVTDQNGYLGSIDSYMSPYLQQVLDPAIADINDELSKGLNSAGFAAQNSGSFGDARHGIAEGELARGAARDVGSLSANLRNNAFNTAMGLRQGDISTKLNTDVSNRDASTAANANKATAASGIAGLGNQYLNQFTDVNDTLFNAGQVEREAQKEQNQALRDFQEAIKNKKYDDAIKLLSAASGSPSSTTSTQKTSSNDGAAGLVGAILGSLF